VSSDTEGLGGWMDGWMDGWRRWTGLRDRDGDLEQQQQKKKRQRQPATNSQHPPIALPFQPIQTQARGR